MKRATTGLTGPVWASFGGVCRWGPELRVAATGCTALALFAAGIDPLGPHSLNNILGLTLIVALWSFVPEMIWRKYT
jgi:hypothetical protein